MSRPHFVTVLGASGSVIWTWAVAVVLVYVVQVGTGLGSPSTGLALSAAALPAAGVAATPPRLRRWSMMLLVVTAVGLLAVVNALYHRFFDDYVPLAMVGAAGQIWKVRGYGAGLLQSAAAPPTLAVLLTAAAALARTRAGLLLA